MLQASALEKHYGDRTLFEGLTWVIEPGVRYGLVGPNGVGKSTLLKILSGQLEPDDGDVVRPRGVRVGYLAQEVDPWAHGSVVEAALGQVPGYVEARDEVRRLHRVLAGVGQGSDHDALLARLGAATERFEAAGGDGLEHGVRAALGGLGFSPAMMEAPAARLSGGWRIRAELARLLAARPDVLLLDEPTNHLDLEALQWFEGAVTAQPGAVVIVSHDRVLLDSLPDRIAELTRRGVRETLGGYQRYLDAGAERREQQQAAQAKVDRQRAHLERFVERFRAKATKAKQAQARIKMLSKLQDVDVADDAPQEAIALRFAGVGRQPRALIRLHAVDKAWRAAGDHAEDTVVYRGLDLEIARGDRLAIIGPNGAGKSTLLKVLAGATGIDGGERIIAPGVFVDHFAQHQLEALSPQRTVYQEAESAAADARGDHREPGITRVRTVLGAMQFSGDAVDKRVAVLSGGEKARLALACMVLRAPTVLLLDEPTNHLDLLSREVLEDALLHFEGALVVVSHDRALINAVAESVIEVRRPGGPEVPSVVSRHPGDYDAWLYHKAGGDPAVIDRLLKGVDIDAEPADEGAPSGAGTRAADRERKRREAERRNALSREAKPLRKRIATLEAEIEALEARIAELTEKQADPAFYEGDQDVAAVVRAQGLAERALEETMADWEEASVSLEALQARYA